MLLFLYSAFQYWVYLSPKAILIVHLVLLVFWNWIRKLDSSQWDTFSLSHSGISFQASKSEIHSPMQKMWLQNFQRLIGKKNRNVSWEYLCLSHCVIMFKLFECFHELNSIWILKAWYGQDSWYTSKTILLHTTTGHKAPPKPSIPGLGRCTANLPHDSSWLER